MISRGDGGRELVLDGVPVDSLRWTVRDWAELARGRVLEVGLGLGVNTRRLIERARARELAAFVVVERSREIIAASGIDRRWIFQGEFAEAVKVLGGDWDTILLDYADGRRDLELAAAIAADGAIVGLRGKA